MAIPKDYPYNRCRSLRHGWDIDILRGATPDDPIGTNIVYELRCVFCGMWRFDDVDRYGDRVGYIHYRQPDGYGVKKEDGLTAAGWRTRLAAEVGVKKAPSKKKQ